jgi:hypothetical protein
MKNKLKNINFKKIDLVGHTFLATNILGVSIDASYSFFAGQRVLELHYLDEQGLKKTITQIFSKENKKYLEFYFDLFSNLINNNIMTYGHHLCLLGIKYKIYNHPDQSIEITNEIKRQIEELNSL